MNAITITIPGQPISKKRPRFVRRGKFVSAYNCQETEEGRWLWTVSQQLGPDFGIIMESPVELNMIFYMPIPASASKKKQAILSISPHIRKPDTDNMIKFCLDCLNGILFRDDSQVWKIEAVKLYGFDAHTEIIVRW